jgi:gas vesicle protein
MEKGEQISKEDFTKFAEYANQRESEYKKGVSTYKAEADRARSYEEAIAPFVPELQAQNISPAAWINNLGRAHMVLSKAPYAEKVQMFQRLAQDYGIQLGEDGVSVPQTDAYTQQLMNQLNQVNQEVYSIKNRFQQEEQSRLMNEIERVRSDVEKFPHFDVVREEMAQLLELGKAPDLETAYKKAVRMNDDVWAIEQERLLASAKQSASKAQQVAKAKTVAVSPKSSTPRGTVNTTEKKDRRSLLAEQINADTGGRV